MSGLQQYPRLEKRNSPSYLTPSVNKSPVNPVVAERTRSMRSFWTDLEKTSGSNSPPMPDQRSPILYSSSSGAIASSATSPVLSGGNTEDNTLSSPGLQRKSSLARQTSFSRLHGPRDPGQSSPSKLKKVVTFEPSHEVIQYEAVTPEISYEDADSPIRHADDDDDDDDDDENDEEDVFNVPVIEPGSFVEDDDAQDDDPPFVSAYLQTSRPLPQLPSDTPTMNEEDESQSQSHLTQKERFLMEERPFVEQIPSPRPEEAINDAINDQLGAIFKSPALSEMSDDDTGYEPTSMRDGKMLPSASLVRKESLLDSQRKVATEHVSQPEKEPESLPPYHIQKTMSQKRKSLNKILEDAHKTKAVAPISEVTEEDEDEDGRQEIQQHHESAAAQLTSAASAEQFDTLPEVPAEIPTGGTVPGSDSPDVVKNQLEIKQEVDSEMTTDVSFSPETSSEQSEQSDSHIEEDELIAPKVTVPEPEEARSSAVRVKEEPVEFSDRQISHRASVSSLPAPELPDLPDPDDSSPLFAMNTPDIENGIAASTEEDTASEQPRPRPRSYLQPRIVSYNSQEFHRSSTEEVSIKKEMPEEVHVSAITERTVRYPEPVSQGEYHNSDTISGETHLKSVDEEQKSNVDSNTPSSESIETPATNIHETQQSEYVATSVIHVPAVVPEIPPIDGVSPFMFSPTASESSTPYVGGSMVTSSSIATMDRFTEVLESEQDKEKPATTRDTDSPSDVNIPAAVAEPVAPLTIKKEPVEPEFTVSPGVDHSLKLKDEATTEHSLASATEATTSVSDFTADISNVKIKSEPVDDYLIPASLRPPSMPIGSQGATPSPRSATSDHHSMDYSNLYPETPQPGNSSEAEDQWGFDGVLHNEFNDDKDTLQTTESVHKPKTYGSLSDGKENKSTPMATTTIRSSSGSKARPSLTPLDFGRMAAKDSALSLELPALQLGDDDLLAGVGGSLFTEDMKNELDKILGPEEAEVSESPELDQPAGGQSPRKVGYVLREHEPIIVKTVNASTHKTNRRKVSGPVRSLAESNAEEAEKWNGPPVAPIAARKKPSEPVKPANPPASERKITEATALTGPAAPTPLLNGNTLNDVSNSPVTLRSHLKADDGARQNDMPTTERGRLYVRVISVKDVNLPGIQTKNAQFNLTLDNGIHCITTENVVLKNGESILEEEFELTVGEDLEFILTLKAKWNKTQRVVKKQVTPNPGAIVPVSSSSQVQEKHKGFSRIFGAHKRLASNASVVSNSNNHQQPITYKEVIEPDTWEYLVAGDGSFARAYVDFSQYENSIFGKPATIELICFNEWARHSDTLKRKEPYKVARFKVEMLFIPRVSKREILPRSIQDAMVQLKDLDNVEPVHMEGALAQLGGDCKFWRRRYFTLDGVNLVAHSESSRKPRASINLAKATALVEDKSELSRPVVVNGKNRRKSGFCEQENGHMYVDEGFRIKFSNGEVIDFYADSGAIKQQWLQVLTKVIGNPLYAHSPWIDAVLRKRQQQNNM